MSGQIFSMRGAIVLAVVLLVVLTAALGRSLAVRSSSPLTLAATDTRTGGGAGVIRWAEKLGFSTLPLQAPLWEIGTELPRSGNAAITAGNGSWSLFDDELTDEQWRDIRRWVDAGNALVIVTSDVESLPDPVDEHFTKDAAGETSALFFKDGMEKTDSDEEKIVAVPSWWGGELAVARRGPRLRGPEDWVLAGTPKSAVLVRRDLGEGRVYLMLDDYAWTNAGLDRADNAAGLARILQRELAPEGVLAVDHYRHGQGRVESFATFLMRLPGAGAFCGMALLIGLAWIWARNQRLGPADEYREAERRTAREYIEAVAAMNQRARAAPLAVESVAGRIHFVLHGRGHVTDEGRRLIERARALAGREQRPASPRDEIKLVRDLVQLRRELHGIRTNPRAD